MVVIWVTSIAGDCTGDATARQSIVRQRIPVNSEQRCRYANRAMVRRLPPKPTGLPWVPISMMQCIQICHGLTIMHAVMTRSFWTSITPGADQAARCASNFSGSDDRVSEQRLIVAPPKAVRPGFLYLGPAGGKILDAGDLRMNDGAIPDGRAHELVLLLPERAQKLPGQLG